MSTPDTFKCGHRRDSEHAYQPARRSPYCRTCKVAADRERRQARSYRATATPDTTTTVQPPSVDHAEWMQWAPPGRWVLRGACRTEDNRYAHLFDPIEGANHDPATEAARIGKAQELCAQCPVIAQCAAYGSENRLPGVWGGHHYSARNRKEEKAAA